MFEQLLSRRFHIARHRAGPYSEERQRYVAFLIEEGRSRSTLRAIPSLLYSLAQWLPLESSAITLDPGRRHLTLLFYSRCPAPMEENNDFSCCERLPQLLPVC